MNLEPYTGFGDAMGKRGSRHVAEKENTHQVEYTPQTPKFTALSSNTSHHSSSRRSLNECVFDRCIPLRLLMDANSSDMSKSTSSETNAKNAVMSVSAPPLGSPRTSVFYADAHTMWLECTECMTPFWTGALVVSVRTTDGVTTIEHCECWKPDVSVKSFYDVIGYGLLRSSDANLLAEKIKGARNTLRAQRIILEEFRLFSCLGDTELHTQIEREFSEFCADARDDEELIQYLSEVAQHPEAEEINWEGLLEEEQEWMETELLNGGVWTSSTASCLLRCCHPDGVYKFPPLQRDLNLREQLHRQLRIRRKLLVRAQTTASTLLRCLLALKSTANRMMNLRSQDPYAISLVEANLQEVALDVFWPKTSRFLSEDEDDEDNMDLESCDSDDSWSEHDNYHRRRIRSLLCRSSSGCWYGEGSHENAAEVDAIGKMLALIAAPRIRRVREVFEEAQRFKGIQRRQAQQIAMIETAVQSRMSRQKAHRRHGVIK